MELILKREIYDDVCTQGALGCSGPKPGGPSSEEVMLYGAYTIERPRVDPQGFPCVPAGRYRLERFISPRWSKKYGKDFAVPLLRGVPGRTAIEIHIANWARQLHGCIAPGDSRGVLEGVTAVVNSTPAFNRLMALLDPAWAAGEDVWLTILDAPGMEESGLPAGTAT